MPNRDIRGSTARAISVMAVWRMAAATLAAAGAIFGTMAASCRISIRNWHPTFNTVTQFSVKLDGILVRNVCQVILSCPDSS